MSDQQPPRGPAEVPPPTQQIPTTPAVPAAPEMPAAPGTTPVAGPPGRPPRQRWPYNARATVTVLAVLVLLGIAGTIVGFAQSSGDDDDGAASTEELEAALDRAETAEEALADLESSSRAQAEALAAERDEALAAAADATDAVEELEAEVTQLTEDNEALTTLVEELAAPFPVEIAPVLPTATDIEGVYRIDLALVRCYELESCDSPPQLADATFLRTADQLIMSVPGQFEIPLTGVGPQLFGVTVDQTLAEPCGGAPRPQETTIALHAATGAVQLDGSITTTGLGGSVIVTAPAFGECVPGEAWYAATLTKVG